MRNSFKLASDESFTLDDMDGCIKRGPLCEVVGAVLDSSPRAMRSARSSGKSTEAQSTLPDKHQAHSTPPDKHQINSWLDAAATLYFEEQEPKREQVCASQKKYRR